MPLVLFSSYKGKQTLRMNTVMQCFPHKLKTLCFVTYSAGISKERKKAAIKEIIKSDLFFTFFHNDTKIICIIA